MDSGQKVTSATLALIGKLISGATVRWKDSEPDTCQRVYYANHTSHLDALVLWSGLPRQLRQITRPVAAADYWKGGPVRRYIASCFNALLIDRKKVSARNSPLNIMIDEMGEKYSLIVFPEGTRNKSGGSGEMASFKSGIYHLSKKRPDLELMPVYLDNLNRILPSGEFLPVPLLSSITIGPPIWLMQGETKDQFLDRARNAIVKLKEDQ